MSKLSDVKLKAGHVAKSFWTPFASVGDAVDPLSYPRNRENFAFEVSGLLPAQILQTTKGPIENGAIVVFNSLGEVAGVGGGSGGTSSPTPLNWVIIDSTTGAAPGYNAMTGDALLVDTSLGEVFIFLPASPNAGDFVNIAPFTPTFQVNNLTVYRNGESVSGILDDVLFDQNYAAQFVYINSSVGWALIQGGETAVIYDVNTSSTMMSVRINESTASPFLIGLLPADSIVTKCHVMVDGSFSGGTSSLIIGGQFNTTGISLAAYSNLLVADHYSNECFFRSGSGSDRYVTGNMVPGVGTLDATILI